MVFIWRRKRGYKFVSTIWKCCLVGGAVSLTTLANATDEVSKETDQTTTQVAQEKTDSASCCSTFLKEEEAIAQSLAQVVALQEAFLGAMEEWITAPSLNPLTGEKQTTILSERNRDLFITFTNLEKQVAEMITHTLTNLPLDTSSSACQAEACASLLGILNGEKSQSDNPATLTEWIGAAQAFLTAQDISFILPTSQATGTLTCSDRPNLINRLIELSDQALNGWMKFNEAWEKLQQLPHSQSLSTAIEDLSKALNDAQQAFGNWLSRAPHLCPQCSLQFNESSQNQEQSATQPLEGIKTKAEDLCSSVFQHTLIYIDHDIQTLTLWLRNGIKALHNQNPMWDPIGIFTKTAQTFSKKLENLSTAVQKLSSSPLSPCGAEVLSTPMKSLAIAFNQTCLAWTLMAEQTFEGIVSSPFTLPLSPECLISHARALCEAFIDFSDALVDAASDDAQCSTLIAPLSSLSFSLKDLLSSLQKLSLPSITFCSGTDFDPEPYRNCLPEITQSLASIPEALKAAKSRLTERNCCNTFASCLYRVSQVLAFINQALDDKEPSNVLQVILGHPSSLSLKEEKIASLNTALKNAAEFVKALSNQDSSQEENSTCLFESRAKTFAQLEQHALMTALHLIPEKTASLKTDWDTFSFRTKADCSYLEELFRGLHKHLQTFLEKLLPQSAALSLPPDNSQQSFLPSDLDETFKSMAEALKSWEEILAWKEREGFTLCSACSLHSKELARETATLRTLFKQAQEALILLKRTPTLQETLSADEPTALKTNRFLRATEEEQNLRPILLQTSRSAQLVHAVEERIAQTEHSLSHITGALGVS